MESINVNNIILYAEVIGAVAVLVIVYGIFDFVRLLIEQKKQRSLQAEAYEQGTFRFQVFNTRLTSYHIYPNGQVAVFYPKANIGGKNRKMGLSKKAEYSFEGESKPYGAASFAFSDN